MTKKIDKIEKKIKLQKKSPTSQKKISSQTKSISIKKSIDEKKIISLDKESSQKKNIIKVSGKIDVPELKKTNEVLPNDYREVDSDSLTRGDIPMTIVDHLDEFRSRLLVSLCIIIALTIAAFLLSDYLLTFIMKPFLETGQKLNIFSIAGGFLIRLKVSVAIAIILGMPVFIFQIWRFILPAISLGDRKFTRVSIFTAIILFYSGISFVFFHLLPLAVPMLLSFISPDLISTIGADDYLSFALMFSIAMGTLFELPIIIMILTKIGILTPRFLIKNRKYSIVIIWIVAALVTPQDVLSQVMVAIPLMFLYEISIIISRTIFIKKHRNELLKRK